MASCSRVLTPGRKLVYLVEVRSLCARRLTPRDFFLHRADRRETVG